MKTRRRSRSNATGARACALSSPTSVSLSDAIGKDLRFVRALASVVSLALRNDNDTPINRPLPERARFTACTGPQRSLNAIRTAEQSLPARCQGETLLHCGELLVEGSTLSLQQRYLRGELSLFAFERRQLLLRIYAAGTDCFNALTRKGTLTHATHARLIDHSRLGH
jgi:hypothetical protein